MVEQVAVKVVRAGRATATVAVEVAMTQWREMQVGGCWQAAAAVARQPPVAERLMQVAAVGGC